MTEWQYHGKTLLDEEIPEKAIGFIYLIRQISSGKWYIGRKMLVSNTTKTVGGKRKKTKKESDWKNYWSSSPQIKEWIEEAGGTQDFTKEILVFVSSKGSLAYLEENALHFLQALEVDNCINQNIRAKIYKKWIKRDEAAELRSVLSKLHL